MSRRFFGRRASSSGGLAAGNPGSGPTTPGHKWEAACRLQPAIPRKFNVMCKRAGISHPMIVCDAPQAANRQRKEGKGTLMIKSRLARIFPRNYVLLYFPSSPLALALAGNTVPLPAD